jgi:hypothetical protein
LCHKIFKHFVISLRASGRLSLKVDIPVKLAFREAHHWSDGMDIAGRF